MSNIIEIKNLQVGFRSQEIEIKAVKGVNIYIPRGKTVALVGYTNAGKSTLFNALTAADVYADSQLFATLDPTLVGF